MLKKEKKKREKNGRKGGKKKHLPRPLDSILEAVLTVSPKRQYRGILRPTTPATHEPNKKQYFINTVSRNHENQAAIFLVSR